MVLFPGEKLNGFGADLLLKLMDLWESKAICETHPNDLCLKKSLSE